MPRARLHKNKRLTQSPKKRKFRKKEEGRPKGTYKRYSFEETRLGFMLKYEAPVVFDIIMRMTPVSMAGEPPLLLIKTICKSSDDTSLKKPKFFRYLEEYARLGLFCKRPKILTEERKIYYEAIRKKKLDMYMKENKDRISALVEYERKLNN
ncbi:hypothetical protein [Dysgonomonas sp. GY75]|uniref:hypothetical protein n=1 Tax=Dysgonomonas sp. GY75 TaxID=2780419 RepID=UPI001A7EE1CC|nr:hypothetical protein [Dysgonomonas sp. GY75]